MIRTQRYHAGDMVLVSDELQRGCRGAVRQMEEYRGTTHRIAECTRTANEVLYQMETDPEKWWFHEDDLLPAVELPPISEEDFLKMLG